MWDAPASACSVFFPRSHLNEISGGPYVRPPGCPFTVPKTLRLRSFAKINTGLKILRPRPDGYHEIRTIYQTVGLHDRLAISISKAGKGIAVECDNPAIPGGQGNLVYRTCEAWAQARGWRGGIRVQIEKAIPLGSGLGGASTNAAATLLGLERLTGGVLDFPARHRLAARAPGRIAVRIECDQGGRHGDRRHGDHCGSRHPPPAHSRPLLARFDRPHERRRGP